MNNETKLVRGVGLLGLMAAIFNCTVGGGIFRLPGSVYALVGSASPLVYGICFVVIMLVASIFVQVGRHVTTTGGPYAYVQPVLGRYFGFVCGVLLWCLATFSMASVANAYAHFTAQLFGLDGVGPEALILGITLAIFAAFNMRSVKSGSSLSLVLSVVKLLPLVVLIFVGLPHLSAERLALPPQLDFGTLARASMILIFAFTGPESALIPSGEIQNPERNLSRALYSALFLVLALYLGVQIVSQSVLGDELGHASGMPLAMTAERLMGTPGKWLLMIGASLSTLGYLSAITMSLPRTLFALAEDGYLPKQLAHVNPTHATPGNAIVTQVIISWALAVSSQFEKLAVLANLSAILMYLLCAVAAYQLKVAGPSLGRKLTAVAGSLAMMFLLTSVTLQEWISVGALIVFASIGYAVKNRKTA